MSRRAALRKVLLATSAIVPLGLASAAANPLGPNVVGGSATVSGTGTSSVVVNQGSHRAIINWNTFNIGAGETTRFIQPSSSSVVLNRVTGNLGPSQLYGTLTANGRVFLVNPDGIMVGPTGVINTAGFLATTHNITNENFMAGRYHFNIPGRPDASIVNEGRITAHSHGFAALVAPGVRNSGTISARFGKIGLAAANGFSLDLYGDQLITLAVGDSIAATVKDVATGQPLGSLVKNDGKLKANGGRVELTAASARTVVDSVINTKGVIEARSIGRREGRIVLGGPTAATKIAGAPVQTVKVSGTLTTASRKGKGGVIQVTGENIEVKSASLDASGAKGGGKVLIGGDTGGGYGHWAVSAIAQAALESNPVPTATTVSVDGATTINASATSSGDGGKVIVWADGTTNFSGSIAARGAGSGNGGFAEVSGKDTLGFSGQVNLGAQNGRQGTLLLDPLNGFIGAIAAPNTILASSIEAALAFADVYVTTNNATGAEAGDLFVNAPITWSNTNNLWLTAYRNVVINANVTNNYSGPAAGDDRHMINVIADNTGTGAGTVSFGSGAKITSGGEINLAFNPSSNSGGAGYAAASENFAGNVNLVGINAVLKHYYKVNTPTDLQNINTNLAANYVLGRNINMSGFSGFAPIGAVGGFDGSFVGLGHTISNLTISSALSNVGLFGILNSTAEVNHLKLQNFNVTANATGGANVGAVVGFNAGRVANVEVTDANITAVANGSNIGGVVGLNSGTLERVNATVLDIFVPGISGVTAGGLVGLNTSSGTITKSKAGVIIDSEADGGSIFLGLLAGDNDGTVNQSWAFGKIDDTLHQDATVGGLLGRNGTGGNVSESYAIPDIIGGAVVGGLIGNNNAATSSLYWTTDTTNSPPVNGALFGAGSGTAAGAGLLSSDLTSGTLPAGFSSTDWVATPGSNPFIPPKNLISPGTVYFIASNNPAVPDSVLAIQYLMPKIERHDAVIEIKLDQSAPPQGGPGGAATRLSQVPGTLPLSSVNLVGNFVQYPCGAGSCINYDPLLRYPHVTNQAIGHVPLNTPPAVLQQIAAANGLTIASTQPLPSNGVLIVQFLTQPGVSVAAAMEALRRQSIVTAAHPNMVYGLVQTPAAAAAPIAATAHRGDPAQYMTGKLHLDNAHRVASGKNITIAVIDSDIDREHAELAGTVVERFDATQTDARAHSHGTAMAGAIVSRDRLLGVAPGARILAVRAFSETQSTAESTTFTILKGIDWAVSQGARVINMSFAGPYDPALERALKAAADRGVVLIAASGNAGPKSPPLWPGADPNVIAVTATDSRDQGFRQANRGPYLSVASPGVEILAPAPDAGYQMSTGTSIATAHVSGVVALMLERDPSLTPRDVRLILESTASDLGPKGRDTQYGWGLVNPAKALSMVDERARQRGSAAAPVQR